MVRKCWGICW